MKLTITIDMDNEAFGDDEPSRHAEVVRILQTACRSVITVKGYDRTLRDINGNTVGTTKVTGK